MRTAIIAGQGRLPAALAAAMPDTPLVAAMDGFAPEGLATDLNFRVERLVPFLRALQRDGIEQVIFAGAVTRPRLDPGLLDEATASLLPRLMAAMAAGDDATLRVVIELFEEFGFTVVGVEDVAPALLPGRGRLVLRVPRTRAAALAQLAGVSLDVAGEELVLGGPHTRELLGHATLYAYSVAAATTDELDFMQTVAEELDALGIRGHSVCGKQHHKVLASGRLDCFSLMLHGLGIDQSLLLQERGLGGRRLLGCGIFVPHKSAAAVGA